METDLIELARNVRDDWNSIAIPFMAYAEQQLSEGDDIWRHLLKIRWPWTIAVTEDVPPDRLIKGHYCQFDITLSQDYKMVSALIAGLTAVLRLYSDRHIIAVWDDQHCGYGFKWMGKDDITIREMTGFEHVM